MKHLSIFTRAVFLFCLLAFSSAAFAQPDPCTDPDIICPIDDYYPVLFLVVIAAAGVKSYMQKKKLAGQASGHQAL